MKKKTIIITAITEKGKEALKTKGKTSSMEKATIKLFGIKETVISEEPYVIETVFKRVPEAVFQQITIGLYTKFIELGATQDKDYTIKVL